ncbi:MAG: transporter-related protein [candidate division NC10 bacterium]|nr:transporter-related protein [candidate division NC10 bacterium]
MTITLSHISKEFVHRGRARRPLYRDVIRLFGGYYTPEQTVALDGVTLDIPSGSRVAIVGANGAGKSTLLRIIAGILQPSRGTAAVRGRVACFFEAGAGAAPALRVYDNVFLYGAIVGLTRREIVCSMDEILDFAELREHADARIEQLSFGMVQRLFFAIMAQTMKLGKADVFLFDEWFAGVDLRYQQKGEELIRRLPLARRIVMYASHDLELLHRLCSTAVYLSGGRVRMFADTATVVERYKTDVQTGG